MLFVCFPARKNEYSIPDVSHIDVQLDIIEFHEDLATLDSVSIQDRLSQFNAEHPAFYQIYFNQVLGFSPEHNDSTFTEQVKEMLNDQRVRLILDTTLSLFPDLTRFHEPFKKAFQYYINIIFPKKKHRRCILSSLNTHILLLFFQMNQVMMPWELD